MLEVLSYPRPGKMKFKFVIPIPFHRRAVSGQITEVSGGTVDGVVECIVDSSKVDVGKTGDTMDGDVEVTGIGDKFGGWVGMEETELVNHLRWDRIKVQGPAERMPRVVEVESEDLIFKLAFKEECNTEKKIASVLKSFLETSMFVESEEKLRRKLFDLLQNVTLIKDPEDPRKFYPRFNVEDTTSFKDLDQHSQNVLKRLYYDYYFCRQEGLWRENALKTLPVLLNSSDMLACGEDLGLIPSCVHPVMQELGLVGLRIQRMPNEPDLEFGIPSQYSYMTVNAPSCHDCSTLRAWWEEDEERRHRFFQTVMGSDELPPDQCTPEIVHFVLRQHVEAPSMWSIFPLQVPN
ncbi:4-alpha-glucanotransferase DPE2 [Capsicum annuum]|uniref:4-alpha-glucanotransferase n=1 Tax=Capsicum annuum TaxID=4072 RepID=A0A2G3A4X0_CAPAN|nr:4-alpha-glucanotransferase DPE2 [Capsicum annuum]